MGDSGETVAGEEEEELDSPAALAATGPDRAGNDDAVGIVVLGLVVVACGFWGRSG